jgi:hypothetical protein
MKTSESIIKIAPAYLTAQKLIESAVKDAENPFFHSKYANLNAVMDACKKALNDNQISILQPVMGDVVETILLHSSGEWFSSQTAIVTNKQNDPQAMGSAISYARRYGLQSMVFIGAEDDDGEGATDHAKPVQPVKTVSKTGLWCDYHNCEMRLNKNGKPYHMDRSRPEGDQFCNGLGFKRDKNKPVTMPTDEEAMSDLARMVSEEMPF